MTADSSQRVSRPPPPPSVRKKLDSTLTLLDDGTPSTRPPPPSSSSSSREAGKRESMIVKSAPRNEAVPTDAPADVWSMGDSVDYPLADTAPPTVDESKHAQSESSTDASPSATTQERPGASEPSNSDDDRLGTPFETVTSAAMPEPSEALLVVHAERIDDAELESITQMDIPARLMGPPDTETETTSVDPPRLTPPPEEKRVQFPTALPVGAPSVFGTVQAAPAAVSPPPPAVRVAPSGVRAPFESVPPPPPRPSSPPGFRLSPPPPLPGTSVDPGPTPVRGLAVIVGTIAVVLGITLGFLIAGAFAGTGDLVVTVSGPSNEVVEGVEIFVDGKLACSTSPCSRRELEPGPHFFRVTAPGYTPSADRVIQVESGHTATFNLNLKRSSVASTIARDAVAATTDSKSSGAEPSTESPPKGELQASETGAPTGPGKATTPGVAGSEPAAVPPPRREADATNVAENPYQQAMGKLSLTSQPGAAVVLDGRPLGATPRLGVSVSAGSHTVMFSHPEHGRKIKTVNVQPGAVEVVSVQFP